MAKRNLQDIFKRLESAGFEFEDQVDGDRVIIVIILPRTKIRCRIYTETDQFQFMNGRLDEKMDRDTMKALSQDLNSLYEALE